MTQAKKGDGAMHAKPKRAPASQEMPGWTNGLRQLYDEVVDEELPEGLLNLLAQFDDGK
jgi:hypothetical protein